MAIYSRNTRKQVSEVQFIAVVRGYVAREGGISLDDCVNAIAKDCSNAGNRLGWYYDAKKTGETQFEADKRQIRQAINKLSRSQWFLSNAVHHQVLKNVDEWQEKIDKTDGFIKFNPSTSTAEKETFTDKKLATAGTTVMAMTIVADEESKLKALQERALREENERLEMERKAIEESEARTKLQTLEAMADTLNVEETQTETPVETTPVNRIADVKPSKNGKLAKS